MSDRFRLVSWEECRPVKVQLNRINQKMYSYMNSNCKELLFDAELVGSGKRGLVTSRIGGNQGFDFDYNLIIDPPEGFRYDADAVKRIFMDALDYAVEGTGFSHASDSTRAMTIKVVDRENSRIVHSCDYAIVYYLDDGYCYLHNDKTNGGSYSFNFRQLKYPVEDMEQFIIDNSKDSHAWIRDKYLQLKNADNQDKQSYILYIEALYAIINEIHQHQQSQDYEDDDDDEYRWVPIPSSRLRPDTTDFNSREVRKWQDRTTATSTARLRTTTTRTSSIRTTTHTGNPEAKRNRIDKHVPPPLSVHDRYRCCQTEVPTSDIPIR